MFGLCVQVPEECISKSRRNDTAGYIGAERQQRAEGVREADRSRLRETESYSARQGFSEKERRGTGNESKTRSFVYTGCKCSKSP